MSHARACRQCSHAKTRCTYDSVESTKCRRCARLLKDCVPKAPASRRDVSPRRDTISAPALTQRFGALEQKVDSLLNFVSLQQASPSSGSAGNSTGTSPDQLLITNPNQSHASPDVGRLQRQDGYSRVLPGSITGSLASSDLLGSQGLAGMQRKDLQSLVDVYRTEYANYFPFIVVPQESVEELQKDHPLLLRAVYMVALYFDRKRSEEIGARLTRDLIDALFWRDERSFDTLQALMLHIAWYHCHLKIRGQIYMLLHAALALLSDLGLSKRIHRNDRRRGVFESNKTSFGFDHQSEDWQVKTHEQRRAVAGCFYLTSIVSMVTQRCDSPKYTKQVEKSCEELLAHSALESDSILAHLIQLQSVVDITSQSLPFDETDPVTQGHIPVSMLLKNLHTKLDGIERSIHAKFSDNTYLQLQLCAARIYVNEISLYEGPWLHDSDTGIAARFGALIDCLESVAAYFKMFFSLPFKALLTMPYILWAITAYALIIGSRLSVLELDGWGKDQFGHIFDFGQLLNDLLSHISEANEYARKYGPAEIAQSGDSVMGVLISRLWRIREWYNGVQKRQDSQGAVDSLTDVPLAYVPMESFEDSFWDQFMQNFA